MILSLRQWFAGRSPRERWMIILMQAIAVPVLAWLLIVRPLNSAYDSTLERHLQAVDRNGRVRMLAELARKQPAAARVAAPIADVGLVVAESASLSGLSLDGNNPAGPNSVSVSASQAAPSQALQWLRDLEARGLAVQEWRMTPAGTGTVSLTARIAKVG
jgi:general secretion pathway protein M